MGVSAARIDDSNWSRFEIHPAPGPVSEKERAAKLVDPGFGRVFTDHMAIVRYDQTKGWHGARIESRANFPLDPASAVLHYAQEIFEGLKAYKRDDGGVNLFRADANARRFRDSADRMAMAPLPEPMFIEAVEQLVRIDRAWIPGGDGSLYLRPFMVASEIFLGVKPSAEYIFAVIALAKDAGRPVREGTYAIEQWRADAASGRLKEAFACGTAAVISPIGKVCSTTGDFVINGGAAGPVAMGLRKQLVDIQYGRAGDPHGWIRKVF